MVIDNLTLLQALAYINKNGCCWRELPTNFGNWDTVYQRFRPTFLIGGFALGTFFGTFPPAFNRLLLNQAQNAFIS
ncbi:MAG: transposase [Planctomycetaceae bacterium]|nr:transposase [Planctomycetaceae bacterium]